MTYKKYILKGLKVNTKSLPDIIVLTCRQIAGILGHVGLCSYENAYFIQSLEKSESVSLSVVSDFVQRHGLYTARLLCPWNYPGNNIAM